MEITKKLEEKKLTLSLEGRLDTITAPELEEVVKLSIDGTTELVLDLAGLDYISSAGLRVILISQKLMNEQGSMKIINPKKEIMEIFDMTGFSDMLTIE